MYIRICSDPIGMCDSIWILQTMTFLSLFLFPQYFLLFLCLSSFILFFYLSCLQPIKLCLLSLALFPLLLCSLAPHATQIFNYFLLFIFFLSLHALPFHFYSVHFLLDQFLFCLHSSFYLLLLNCFLFSHLPSDRHAPTPLSSSIHSSL